MSSGSLLLDYERGVIAAILLDPAELARVLGRLTATHFSKPSHRAVYGAIERLSKAGKPITLLTIAEELMQSGEFERIGGHRTLSRLIEAVPKNTPIDYYIDRILEGKSAPYGQASDEHDDPVQDLLTASGLADLPENADFGRIEVALQSLAGRIHGVDVLRRASVREATIRRLKTAGVSSPARLVDAALGVPAGAAGGGEGQGRAVLLADIEPWPDVVEGDELLDELAGTFRRFLALPEGAAEAMALWTLHAYAHDAASVSPILTFSSAVKRCGKTTAEDIVAALCPRPLPTSNISPAALFRAVEKFRPTLIVDEAETILARRPGQNEELRGILNGSHLRTSATVIRTVGDAHEPRVFSTWCAKVVGLIGRLPATLEDRSIVIPMRRRAPGERVERLRRDRIYGQLELLRRQAARWALDHLEELRQADPAMPEQLHDRAQDNWRPLLAIAECAGGNWPERARGAALRLSAIADETDTSLGIQLLSDLRGLFAERGADRLSSAEIVGALVKLEDRPWPECGTNGRPLTPRFLASLLKAFDIRPKDLRMGEGKSKGYEREALNDAWSRYLPSDPRQGRQASNGAENASNSIRDNGGSVSDRESSEIPRPACVVADVADQNAVSGKEEPSAHSGIGSDPSSRRCHACKGRRFWLPPSGAQPVCATCHPPANPALVISWLGGDGTRPAKERL